MAKIPVALQLYSVRDDCARDLPGTLQAVADMGYVGVEFAGYHNRSAAELRKLLDDLGLRVAGTHTMLETLLGDELERTADFNRAIGNRFLIVPWLPDERHRSRAAWLETVGLISDAAERAQPLGMRVGYHNHMFEFEQFDGETLWDIFFNAARPEVVMQLDTGNAVHGGGDPVALLQRHPGRATTVHLKEHSRDGFALVGDGDVPWAEVFRLCETTGGTEWYIVEHEVAGADQLDGVRHCIANLRRMGKL